MKSLNGINGILLMNLNGMPLLFEEFELNSANIDPTLLSGYLQALDLFGKNSISGGKTNFNLEPETYIEKTAIDYGKRKILFLKFKMIKIAVIFDDNISNMENLSSKVIKIAEKFLNEYKGDFDGILDVEIYEPFKNIIISELICSDMEPWWVPKVVNSSTTIDPKFSNEEILSKINGQLNIAELQDNVSLSYEKICKCLYVWKNYNLIEFNNVLDKNDILKLHKKGREYLSVKNPQNLCRSYQAKVCPFLNMNEDENCYKTLKQINGKKSVHEIKNDYISELTVDTETVIQCLIDNKLVEPLSEDERNIYFSKKLLHKLIEVMQSNLKKSETTKLVQKVLEDIHSFEITSDIKIQGSEIIIDYNYALYQELDRQQLNKLADKWMNINFSLIENISKKQKKIIEDLVVSLNSDFIEYFRKDELRRFADFSMHLEALMA